MFPRRCLGRVRLIFLGFLFEEYIILRRFVQKVWCGTDAFSDRAFSLLVDDMARRLDALEELVQAQPQPQPQQSLAQSQSQIQGEKREREREKDGKEGR